MFCKLLFVVLALSTSLLADEPLKAQIKQRSISGTISDADGNPVAAEVWIHWFNAKAELLDTAKADGSFAATLPFGKGEYDNGGYLLVRAKGYGPAFQIHGEKYDPESLNPKSTLNFKLPKERKLTGRVVDATGRPVVGAKLATREVSSFSSDAEADKKLLTWAKDEYLGNPPHSPARIGFYDGLDNKPFLSFLKSPYTATTNADGEFEISGLGANQLVTVFVRGDGLAHQEFITLNRDGFDPTALVTLIEAREVKEKWNFGKWKPRSPNPLVQMEQEKILRGKITDDLGNPLVGVDVTFNRPTPAELVDIRRSATTDKDGKYEIRGAKKHKAYILEVPSNAATGTMMCQLTTKDSDGFEPLTIDIICKRGVVITGRMTNKATGKPIKGADVRAEVLRINPFVKQYPDMTKSATGSATNDWTDADGKFRVVTIPGPVLLIGRTYINDESEFIPPVADPNFPKLFKEQETTLLFDGLQGMRHLNGDWCKVIESKATSIETTVNIEMVPARKTLVKVVDNDGQPVLGTKATGISQVEFNSPKEFADTASLTLLNLEPKKDRLLVVYHEKSKRVGSLMLNADTKDPVVKLDVGGTILGRAVDKDGKPLAGLKLSAKFDQRQATEAFNGFHKYALPETDANGEFRLGGLFPGVDVKLYYKKDGHSYGLEKLPTPVYKITKAGEFVKTGDMTLLIDHE
jgi:hypothetical protein